MRQQHPRFQRVMGNWLKVQRLSLELSQQKFWGPLEVTFQQGQKFESGVNRLPFVTLVKLFVKYKVSLDALATYLAPYLKEKSKDSLDV